MGPTDRRNSGVVEDIWMNTQADPDGDAAIPYTGDDAPANREEIEQATYLINPDPASMDGRG
jgi:hypothetical protein